jgi:hypothetical protein
MLGNELEEKEDEIQENDENEEDFMVTILDEILLLFNLICFCAPGYVLFVCAHSLELPNCKDNAKRKFDVKKRKNIRGGKRKPESNTKNTSMSRT